MKKRAVSRFLLLALNMLFLSLATVGAQLPSSLTNGLVSYYNFNGNANDVAGTNNATVFGAVLTNGITGAPSTAYYFNGSSDYLLADYTPTTNNAFTWSVWVKPNAAAPGMWVLSNIKDFTTGSFSPVILFRSNTPAPVSFYTANGLLANEFASVSSVPTNLWTMLTFTSDTNNQRGIYLNGVLNASGSSTDYGQPLDKLLIGGAAVIEAPNQYYFDGSLDDVTIYNRPLSSTEVADLYQAQLVPEPSTYALLLMAGFGALWAVKRRSRGRQS